MVPMCNACVVTCEDFRLHGRANRVNTIGEYIKSLGGECDLVTRGGAIQDLVRPEPGFDESLLRDIGVSVNHHKVGTIHLVNHEDCGAYGQMAFESREAELAQHRKDLATARNILNERFPGVDIVLAFAELAPGTEDRYTVRCLS